ncbi:hypothetical protein QR680_015470 [Steinernema hermaphroditum]|uniref:Uncharacterized protein n=1 Tax=Steinernema hermaphroditum TaxID=289476 RepID=A0AA39LKW0_9BILA|nr:hypothetical protein QR680_015470 [Steinernema hermaphroditum]
MDHPAEPESEVKVEVFDALQEKLDVDRECDDKVWDLIDAFRDVRDTQLPAAVKRNVDRICEELDMFPPVESRNAEMHEQLMKEVENLARQKAEEEKKMRELRAEIDEIDRENEAIEGEIADLIFKIRNYAENKGRVKKNNL